MTPQQFINKWKASSLKESAASQSHFIDLCQLLGQQAPTDADPDGTWYCFEAGAAKTGGGDGWADVWKKDCFAWEYKGKHKDLDAAYAQLQRYAVALQNPPLLIVSDMETIIIHTNWTYTVHTVIPIPLEDLVREEALHKLVWAFTDPERLKPGLTREALTEEAARDFATLAKALHQRGFDPKRVAHFVNRLLFCMFAEDVRILPPKIFTRMVEVGTKNPQRFQTMAAALFSAMRQGGTFGVEVIDWFNGGLFDDDDVLPLTGTELGLLRKIARLDWSEVEPSIFGTLFERGLDPAKRSQLGAHYTDRQSIMRIVDPVVLNPLRREWEGIKQEIVLALSALPEASKLNSAIPSVRNAARRGAAEPLRRARQLQTAFLDRIRHYSVLDPACGSGNFLYLSLLGLKDLEHQVSVECEQLGLEPVFPLVGPEVLHGIEISPYAAELARVTIWIGQLQWMARKNYLGSSRPILSTLDQISCRDALLNGDGTEAEWPAVECIIGNPPFLGDKKMISEMGEENVTRLRRCYEGRVPGGADLVTYWFAKAHQALEVGNAMRVGLVSTNSIRGGLNRKVLDDICDSGQIFEAWSDEDWILDGAAVRVSIVCFSSKTQAQPRLDGQPVSEIYADLTGKSDHGSGVDLTVARPLVANLKIAFQGVKQVGRFTLPGRVAREWMLLPSNPNGRTNSDVLRPWVNGQDITKRPTDTWIVDFGVATTREVACLYQTPFEYVATGHKRPKKNAPVNPDAEKRPNWWLLERSRPKMRSALGPLHRFIVTPRVAKHRLFVWATHPVLPDTAVVVIAREDDATFGILHSRFHEAWTLRKCTWLGVGNDPRYTQTTTFETFPFPEGLTPNAPAIDYASDPRAAAIAEAAQDLDQLRARWLNPPELVKREPEVVPGFPDRLIPVSTSAEVQLKKRTLTNLYNENPTWLQQAHRRLDEAVAAAYGWPADISDDEALRKLLELNLSRAASDASSNSCVGTELDESEDLDD